MNSALCNHSFLSPPGNRKVEYKIDIKSDRKNILEKLNKLKNKVK